MTMLNNRQTAILDMLEQHGKVQVTKLALHFSVSEVTIRKDLQELEEQSLLKRVYGGAVATRRSKYNPSHSHRKISDAKIAMAQAALTLIDDGDTLILDAGSSTLALAQQLTSNFRGLTIVTNSLSIIIELIGSEFELISLGGIVRQHSYAQIGPLTVATLGRLHADKVFLGATSATVLRGVGTPNIIEAESKKAMISAATECVALVDSSKLGQVSLASYAGWEDIDVLVTDAPPPEPFELVFAEKNVRLVVAQTEPAA